MPVLIQMILIFMVLHLQSWLHLWRISVWKKRLFQSLNWLIWHNYTKTRLEQLGVAIEGRVHTSRLKLRLLSVFPDLRAHLQGRKVMLTFDDDIGGALRKACDHDSDHDALHLVRAAKVVRREMFNQNFTFNGSFSEQSVVPQSLLAFVNMILEGPNIKHHNSANTTAAISISQLLMFNSVKQLQMPLYL